MLFFANGNIETSLGQFAQEIMMSLKHQVSGISLAIFDKDNIKKSTKINNW